MRLRLYALRLARPTEPTELMEPTDYAQLLGDLYIKDVAKTNESNGPGSSNWFGGLDDV